MNTREGINMKISASAIQLHSERSFTQSHTKTESLTVWKGDEGQELRQTNGGSAQLMKNTEKASLAETAVGVNITQQAARGRRTAVTDLQSAEEQEVMLSLNFRVLQSMIERTLGKRMAVVKMPSAQGVGQATEPVQQKSVESGSVAEGDSVSREGGMIYEYHESYSESESSSFQADGTLVTEDGKEIDFSVSLTMSRSFYEEHNISLRTGEALKDPLVINFSGTAAQLNQTDFSFDIDNDGADEQIAFLREGSGFLALDGNNDGIINNGSELFGPESGNGFTDLAGYDSDGNNWIDGNDPIYEKLRIWTRDSDGNSRLFALGEKGIGALYLGSAATRFSLTDAENSLLGQVQSTGIFVRENGSVGTIQQVDLLA